jgi:hypothetical protein
MGQEKAVGFSWRITAVANSLFREECPVPHLSRPLWFLVMLLVGFGLGVAFDITRPHGIPGSDPSLVPVPRWLIGVWVERKTLPSPPARGEALTLNGDWEYESHEKYTPGPLVPEGIRGKFRLSDDGRDVVFEPEWVRIGAPKRGPDKMRSFKIDRARLELHGTDQVLIREGVGETRFPRE